MRNKAGLIIVYVFLTGLIATCDTKSSSEILARGFIVFDDPNYWFFVPVETIDTSNCFENFQSEALKRGIQFNPSKIPETSYIKRTLDTLRAENLGSGFLKITPVELKYSLEPKYLALYSSSSNDPKWNYNYKVLMENNVVEFVYNIFPVTITNVKPLFCLNMKKANIGECSCNHGNDDPHDYLFKICNYIKDIDQYSDLPCKYGIKSITSDTLENREVIKIELTCCYLGDVALFDKATKEIINISFGAK